MRYPSSSPSSSPGNSRTSRLLLWLFLLVGGYAGCAPMAETIGSLPQVQTRATPIEPESPAATATPSATARPTNTPQSTDTPSPTPTPQPTPTPTALTPQPILEIPLAGPATFGRPEYSGMAWYGEHLVLLPQYPGRFAAGDGALFVLDRAEIEAFVDGTHPGPLTPRPLPLDAPGLRAAFPGYEGFEAIAFAGDRVYLTVESSPPGGMVGWIVAGEVEPDLSRLLLDVASAVAIAPQADLSNMSDEAIVLWRRDEGITLHTIYEANGRQVNPAPVAHRFDAELAPLAPLPFAPIEYRITDATPADAEGRFWAINYFWPGDVKLKPGSDPLLQLLVSALPHVERLVEFQITTDAVAFTSTPPLYLELLESDARNWEGIARLGERGFLLITDTHPRTILAYVERP